jgi:hypothetical protein
MPASQEILKLGNKVAYAQRLTGVRVDIRRVEPDPAAWVPHKACDYIEEED